MNTKETPQNDITHIELRYFSILNHIASNSFLSQGKCPYIEAHKSITYAFSIEKMNPALYEAMISSGFRRDGYFFYKNLCPGCRSCIPIRIDINNFRPSKSQRRILKKNQDVTITRNPVGFDPESFLLYQKYCTLKHGSVKDEEDYMRFLIDSPVNTDMMRYYIGNHLIGIGWIDVLPNSLSSVYYAFDPDFSSRGPGVFSLLKEIELCRELKKEWLQLGFWIEECHKMSYKNRYKPYQLLTGGTWQEC
ncbi:MAG: arginyltransferase [Desulfobacterales bacterium]|nr:arginyltransferase [Desulfobacterales bacterium]